MPELRIVKKPAAKPLTYGECVGQVVRDSGGWIGVATQHPTTREVTLMFPTQGATFAGPESHRFTGELLGPIEIVEVEEGDSVAIVDDQSKQIARLLTERDKLAAENAALRKRSEQHPARWGVRITGEPKCYAWFKQQANAGRFIEQCRVDSRFHEIVDLGEPQSVTECNRVTDADRKRAGELADKVDVPGWYLREVKEAAALLRKFASATSPAVPLPGEIARMVKWLRDPNKPQFSMEHHLRDAADMIEALHAGASKDAEAKP